MKLPKEVFPGATLAKSFAPSSNIPNLMHMTLPGNSSLNPAF
ncbi:hypothetical protein [Methylomonas albis]|nr:hypothetical protein [Methylomonas albis]